MGRRIRPVAYSSGGVHTHLGLTLLLFRAALRARVAAPTVHHSGTPPQSTAPSSPDISSNTPLTPPKNFAKCYKSAALLGSEPDASYNSEIAQLLGEWAFCVGGCERLCSGGSL